MKEKLMHMHLRHTDLRGVLELMIGRFFQVGVVTRAEVIIWEPLRPYLNEIVENLPRSVQGKPVSVGIPFHDKAPFNLPKPVQVDLEGLKPKQKEKSK